MRSNRYTLPALLLLLCLALTGRAQSLDSLSLRDTDSNLVRLSTFANKKALVLIFTGNHCVYSKKYEDRLIHIANEFSSKDIAFFLVNSNDPELSQDDRFALMRERAKEKAYPCPYLWDPTAALAKAIGASKNPEVFVVRKGEKSWEMLYSGKIDDNPLIEERVERKFLVEELNRIVAGDYGPATPVPAVGCNIKMKE
jgi:thiol-disulfide isomerase/thioredoxin